ncbi:peroxisomal membrane protein 11B-like isoform X1 [Tachypleus tridentatus]|uniref:peroxisomal membrane protein 11B-like isoform X1 n=1 Tax=Tachypleus tridentatus TaxID=6853 RepID=UPI003FD2E415
MASKSPLSSDILGNLVKFNSQTAGREKLLRLVQYGTRMLWALMEKYSHDKEVVFRLKNLEHTFSAARKLFRFGRSLDAFYSALSTINIPDQMLRITITFSRINLALYLLADHVLWLGQAGIANVNKDKWSKLSNRFWLYSLVMNLVRDMYEILTLLQIQGSQTCALSVSSVSPYARSSWGILIQTLLDWMVYHRSVTVELIKNGCDIWIPLTNLKIVKFSPAAVGLLGVLSSVAGILQLINVSYKLSPS